MKKKLLTLILLSAGTISLQAGFGKSFGASFGGSFLGSSLANAGNRNNDYEDCSFEKAELRKVKRTYKKLKQRNSKLKALNRKVNKAKKARINKAKKARKRN